MAEADIPQPDPSPDTNPAAPPAPQTEVVSDKLPTAETIQKCDEYTVLDKNGATHTFKSLYDGPDTTSRVLIIFIRHFFCGSCQEFITALAESITPSDLLGLSKPTSIAIIGCGDPGLIDFYATETKCPFPIYADPDRKLYKELGLVSNLALGAKPGYFRVSMTRLIGRSFMQTLGQIGSGMMNKGGPSSQNGGEFLFGEEKSVAWCHRMTNTRDHPGMEEMKRVLDPEGLVLKE